jgi:hypothetical protein
VLSSVITRFQREYSPNKAVTKLLDVTPASPTKLSWDLEEQSISHIANQPALFDQELNEKYLLGQADHSIEVTNWSRELKNKHFKK